MLNQAAAVALRILLFRAGPQDFPYSSALTRLVVPLAAIAAFLQYQLTLPVATAAVHAVTNVAVVAVFTQFALQLRTLGNRLQQTVNSLYATGIVMTLLLLAPLSAIAPHMMRIAENPELARTEQLPGAPAMAVIALSLWHFFVAAHIYRHALNTNMGVGALLALISAILTMSLAGAIGAALT